MPTGPGVLQVGAGGAGANITVEDNTNVDAGGDGSYSLADIAAACVAKGFFAADGVTPAVSRASLIAGYGAISRETYFTFVTVTNGDGVGVTPTTIKDVNVDWNFITGKTYVVSNVGVANRTTEFGVEIPGSAGKPSSQSGVDVYFGAAPTLRGASKIFGCKFVAVGNLIFQPATTGLNSRIVNFIGEATGTLGFGLSTGEIAYMFNVDATSTTAGAGGLVQFNCLDAERLVIAAPNATQIIATAGIMNARDVVLVGGAGTTADFRNTTGGIGARWVLRDWVWSREGPNTLSNVGCDTEDWRSYGIRAFDPDAFGVPRAGLDWRVKNGADVIVASGVTNSEGQSSFGTGNEADGLLTRVMLAGTQTWLDVGPFTTEVNYVGGPNYNPALETYSKPATWPGNDYADGRQLEKKFDMIPIGPPPAPGVVASIDGITLDADGIETIVMPIPSAA